MTDKYHFACVDCHAEYAGDQVIYLCPVCGAANQPGFPPRGVLKTLYPYQKMRDMHPVSGLFDRLQGERFLPLLPLHAMDSWPRLEVGNTPLYRLDGRAPEAPVVSGNLQVENSKAGFKLFLKDDSQNPTFSFKDRASALVSAWARENNIHTLITASTGNAGSSLAGICASQGQESVIVVPAAAPLAKLTQILMYGAILVPVKGTYDDAFDTSVEITARHGWYNRNTAYNPLTIEGKKTVAFELYQQLGYQVPDRIFIPVGDGVIYSAVCKGFEDLLMLGIIDRMPVAVAVQSEGSSNLIDNLGRPFVPVASKTVADSISVDVPRCFHMTAGYISKYDGETIAVSDGEILAASLQVARSAGIFCEPAAAAAYAGMEKYRRLGLIPAGSSNVVLLTGSGLKDLEAVQSSISIPEPVGTDRRAVDDFLNKQKISRS
ncbi:MAG: pyridoxal-phosphate dependent enzyme [Bacteroidota bacterium]